ncbi:MAG TPA: hypothetical protein VEB19_04140 [Gemmatimonadaceae bacterium]|nr:hypothetical protein [Gemmatimonadaceae bacterium]
MPEPSNTEPNEPSVEGMDEPAEVVRDRVIRLAFGGDRGRYEKFIRTIREAIPPDVTVIMRGSAVTGKRWRTEIPFDADGPGTSDIDLTLIGGEMVKLFDVHYIPGLHTAPLSDDHPDASVMLIPLRQALTSLAGRPVNIQASANLLQFMRDVVMSQPYLIVIDADAQSDGAAPA